jgi:hypothetical protein
MYISDISEALRYLYDTVIHASSDLAKLIE